MLPVGKPLLCQHAGRRAQPPCTRRGLQPSVQRDHPAHGRNAPGAELRARDRPE